MMVMHVLSNGISPMHRKHLGQQDDKGRIKGKEMKKAHLIVEYYII